MHFYFQKKKSSENATVLHYGLVVKSLGHLRLFLCMIRGSVLTSSIYMWLSCFPNTTCNDICPFSVVCSLSQRHL